MREMSLSALLRPSLSAARDASSLVSRSAALASAAPPDETPFTDLGSAVHFAPKIADGPWLRCMAPDGAWADASVQWGIDGRACLSPNRFVAVASCPPDQKPANEPKEARRAATSDHSIIGDTFGGLLMCIVPPPF